MSRVLASDQTATRNIGGEALTSAIRKTLGMDIFCRLIAWLIVSLAQCSYNAGRGKQNEQNEPCVVSSIMRGSNE